MIDAAREAAPRRNRLLVLMENRNNAALVCAALQDRYDVVGDPYDLPPGDDLDLCIVDGVSLRKHGPDIQRTRNLQEPLFLPVILLTERDTAEARTSRAQFLVDDVVKRPVSKTELELRIETLLRTRSLSRQVVAMEGRYENERLVAERFQDAALPRELPQVCGVHFSAYYSAGQSVANIGGDWYDALALEDGRVVISIGDVCGSGLDAAVAMAHVRQVIRGVAHIHPDPQMMLDAANRNLHAEDSGRMVTAFVGVLDAVTSQLTYANAGHVPPLLRLPDGSVHELRAGDLPLGVLPVSPASHDVAFPAGASLVLYTDGLTEYARDAIAAQHQLEQLLEQGDVLRERDPAKAIFAKVVHGVAVDDVAILVVRRDDRPLPLHRWSFTSTDERHFRDAQASICRDLKDLGFDDNGCVVAKLVLSELVGNVVRYASGSVELLLETSANRPVIHVLDRGPAFTYAPRLPSNVFSENGRGLFTVKELTHEFNVTARLGGGSHARAVLHSGKDGPF